jgi:hypothetical protein
MSSKKSRIVEILKQRLVKYIVNKKDKELFIESAILIVIYFVSFVILSLGRVQQTFLGISASTFSSIQIITLTFIFAGVIALIIYSAYRKVIGQPIE